MRQLLAFIIVAIMLGACSAERFPILHPKTGPGTAYPCGLQWHACSDGFCCPNGFSCTVDRLPIYADPPGRGFCTYEGSW